MILVRSNTPSQEQKLATFFHDAQEDMDQVAGCVWSTYKGSAVQVFLL